jgi:TrmH family RNA methyltransferase
VLVEGVRAVREALLAGAEVRFAVASPRLDALSAGALARDLMREHEIEVIDVDEDEFVELSDTEHPQGILLVCVEPRQVGELVQNGGRYLVLDAVQDPGNVGTLVRAATAFDLDGVLMLDGSADPWSPKAVRASAGMMFRTPVRLDVAGGLVSTLAAASVPVLVADTSGRDVREVVRTGGWALVVGNEGAGAREQVRVAARELVRVPMAGPAESLNAGVAGAILLYALTREDVSAG